MRIMAQSDGVLTDADQQELTRILAKAGYTVRRVKVKKGGTSSGKVSTVDYWGDMERAELP